MSLPLWEECSWVKGEVVDDLSASVEDCVFPRSDRINGKIYLHCGKIYQLPADIMIVGQNDTLTSMVDDMDAIYALAGPQLEDELSLLRPIETGESAVTGGYQLPCKWLIHAVGPKYDKRYLTASDHALFTAYQSSLVHATEKNAKSIVIQCVYLSDKHYPRFDAAHVALRTVRKFMEHKIADSFEKVMFCVPTQDDYEIYSALMTAYFPRNSEEEASAKGLLPAELGDEWGAINIADRVLKVSAGPKPVGPRMSIDPQTAAETLGQNFKTGDRHVVPTMEEHHSTRGMMSSSTGDMDEDDIKRKRSVQQALSQMSREELLKIKFQALLDDVDEESYEEEEAKGFLTIIGEDRKGRTVILITAANLKGIETEEQQDRVLLYFMKTMEPFRCLPFVLVYAQSAVTEESAPDMTLIQSIFDLFTARYKENMLQLYILHASFMFRMYIWIALPFVATPFWSNYICTEDLKQLNTYMDIKSLDIPDLIADYDKSVSGRFAL